MFESLKKWLDSKKTKTFLTGLVSTVLTTYVLKDNPELAMKVSAMIVTMATSLILGQGAADAFGTEYHKKK